jgi:hypothetical protein
MLTQTQVTALTAQAARAAQYSAYDDAGNLLTGWELNDFDTPVYTGTELATRGVGVYGQTPSSLVLTGYLKPASLNLITAPDMTAAVLNTPAVWTGQYGIASLLDYLNSTILQNISQQALLVGSFRGLVDAGYLTGNEDSRYIATLLQPAAKYGVTAVILWIENQLSPTDAAEVATTARQGQYAIDFVTVNSDQLTLAPDSPGVAFTITRDELDLAVTELIGNPKIASPDYVDIVDTLTQNSLAVNIPGVSSEDGTFRFAPGSNQG